MARIPSSLSDLRPKSEQGEETDNTFVHEELSLYEIYRKLLNNQEFVSVMIAISGLYFVVAGIQFWFPYYFQEVLHADRSVTVSLFAIISITGPSMGVIVGGLVTSYYGGYNSLKA